MKIPLSQDDIFFACALVLEKPLSEILGVTCEFEGSSKQERPVFFVEIKDFKGKMKIAPNYNRRVDHTEWVYDYLRERDLWGWQKKTRN